MRLALGAVGSGLLFAASACTASLPASEAPEPSDSPPPPAVLAPEAEPEVAQPEPSAPVDQRGFDLSREGLRFDGQLLPESPKLAEIQALFGITSDVRDLVNTIHVYHDIGITVFVLPGTDQVIEINVYYALADVEFMPRALFTGEMRIGGVALDSSPRIDSLRGWLDELDTEYGYVSTYTRVNASTSLFLTVEDELISIVSVDFPH